MTQKVKSIFCLNLQRHLCVDLRNNDYREKPSLPSVDHIRLQLIA
jgi:hypothetical protein